MAEDGLFRSSIHGFHRQDVLSYIDSQQAQYAQEAAALQQLYQEARQQAESLQAQLEQKTAECQQAAAENEQLRADNDQLEELVNQHNQANRELRKQLEALPQLTAHAEETASQLDKARQQIAALHAKLSNQDSLKQKADRLLAENARLAAANAHLQQQHARYQQLTRQLEAIAAETRQSGQGFLRASCQQSEECLSAMEGMVASFEEELSDTRRRIGEVRTQLEQQSNAAGLQLDGMVHRLITEGGSSAPAATATGAADEFTFQPSTQPTETVEASAPVHTAPATHRPTSARPLHREEPRRSGSGWLANWLK